MYGVNFVSTLLEAINIFSKWIFKNTAFRSIPRLLQAAKIYSEIFPIGIVD